MLRMECGPCGQTHGTPGAPKHAVAGYHSSTPIASDRTEQSTPPGACPLLVHRDEEEEKVQVFDHEINGSTVTKIVPNLLRVITEQRVSSDVQAFI
jgi:hypothetical protein